MRARTELATRVRCATRTAVTAGVSSTAATEPVPVVHRTRYAMIDCGANLTDAMYRGEYHGKLYHARDLDAVLRRAWDAGLESVFLTAGSLSEAEKTLNLAMGPLGSDGGRLRCTVGVHPTRCTEEFGEGDPAVHIERLWDVCARGLASGAVVAIGECGLDYDRLEFCPAATQKRCFEAQFVLAERSALPMFFHCRAAASDFLDIVRRNRSRFVGGVVHSFDGSASAAAALIALDLYIGINGCSLRTAENIAVARSLPADRIVIETDAPWCDVRKTHAGWPLLVAAGDAAAVAPRPRVDKKKLAKGSAAAGAALVKGRNEPCELDVVLLILARARGVEPAALAAQIKRNTERCFGTR